MDARASRTVLPLVVKSPFQVFRLLGRGSILANKKLLAIIELGGYPNFTPLYKSLGYDVSIESSMRKVLKRFKKDIPDVVVAEFNFQSDFRDRTSSLESLMSVVERQPDVKTIIFYDKEFKQQLARLEARFSFDYTMAFPLDEQVLKQAIASF
jgi:N-glycosylase/DNA lyase